MFGIILSSTFIAACLWISITAAIAAFRYRERVLALLAISTLLLVVSQSIPLTNLIIGGFGAHMEAWIIGQLAVMLLGIGGIATFNLLGGSQRLRRKGLSLKRILLLQSR